MLNHGFRTFCVLGLALMMGVGGLLPSTQSRSFGAESLQLIFLGDQGHHQPSRRAGELLPVLQERGIEVRYREDVDAVLSDEVLEGLDGLILYANIDNLGEQQAESLLRFVSRGGGFIPLHCASFCFRNQPEVVALMGAQFQRHGAGVFSVESSEAASNHPLMQGYSSFES
ncbi:MAG: ThuA domain-containing protein, partial [Planctomycetota bacterium]|nr:ThuA domain-containing protein [Planctomycetota bacterium]